MGEFTDPKERGQGKGEREERWEEGRKKKRERKRFWRLLVGRCEVSC